MSERTHTARERAQQALELHLAGKTYREIADLIGYSSTGGAHKAVERALAGLAQASDRTPRQDIELQIHRLNALLAGLWPRARRGDVQAVDRVLKIEERRTGLRQLLAGAASAEAGSSEEDQPEEEGVTPIERARRIRRERAAGVAPGP